MTGEQLDLAAFQPWVDKANAALSNKLDGTRAPSLRLFHIALIRSLEENEFSFPQSVALLDPPVGYAARHFITRLANEVGGVTGCLYWGSPLAALHHVRALMEFAACAKHLHPSNGHGSLSRRWSRLQEFEHAARAAQYEKDAAIEGVVPYDDATDRFSDADVAFFKGKRDEWIKLYGLKKRRALADLTHWHEPASIKDLFAALPGEHWALYGHICNCTHFSPLGERLGKAPKGGFPLFVTDEEPVNRVVNLAIEYIGMTADILDQITPAPRLTELVALLSS